MSNCRIVDGWRRAIEILVSYGLDGCFLRRARLSTAGQISALRGVAPALILQLEVR